MALPLAIAFAIASGVTPDRGLYTAIIRMRHVPAIDSTAMHALRDLVRRTRRDGTVVLFSEVNTQPMVALERSGLLHEIGQENLVGDIDEALEAAKSHVAIGPEPSPSRLSA